LLDSNDAPSWERDPLGRWPRCLETTDGARVLTTKDETDPDGWRAFLVVEDTRGVRFRLTTRAVSAMGLAKDGSVALAHVEDKVTLVSPQGAVVWSTEHPRCGAPEVSVGHMNEVVLGCGYSLLKFAPDGRFLWQKWPLGNTSISKPLLLRDGAMIVSGGGVIELAVGNNHTCALLNNGNVRCWGFGGFGGLGYGDEINIGDDESPASAGDVNVGGAVIQLVAGNSHTCALLKAGNVRCWGAGNVGQHGYGNTNDVGDDETPASVGDVNVGGVVTQLVAGSVHTCALLTNGAVRCWGGANNGRLGYGNANNIGDDESPAQAGDVNVGGAVKQLAAGGAHTCALLEAGDARCWGNGSRGRLGYGNTDDIGDDESPAQAGDVSVGGVVKQLVAGRDHTCALLDTGSVRCWGFNFSGQLGYGDTNDIGDDETPASAGDLVVF
jgi:alpha-tubulin suppressor-like RCC1 family protein